MATCPQSVEGSAHKGGKRPVLEYVSSSWDLCSIIFQDELEKMEKRAIRFTGNITTETKSMTGLLEKLNQESLKKWRKDSRPIMLCKDGKGVASTRTNDLVPSTESLKWTVEL